MRRDKRTGTPRKRAWRKPSAPSGECPQCHTFRLRLHKDHIVPKWSGGSDTPDNWQFLCANCHEDKTAIEQQSAEYRAHVSNRYLGMVRKPLTPEHREKLRLANLGRKPTLSAERNRKISAAMLGRKKSPEHCAAISRAKLGKPRRKLWPIFVS